MSVCTFLSYNEETASEMGRFFCAHYLLVSPKGHTFAGKYKDKRMKTLLEYEPQVLSGRSQSGFANIEQYPELEYDESGQAVGYNVEHAFRELDANLSTFYGVDFRKLRNQRIAEGEQLADFRPQFQ